MKCHNHSEIEAVGICKHCQKGLCLNCATDLEFGLACKDKHEQDVIFLHALIEKNKRAYESMPRASLFTPIFFLLMGSLFTFFGFTNGIEMFLILMGAGFIIFGVAIYIYNSNYFKNLNKDV